MMNGSTLSSKPYDEELSQQTTQSSFLCHSQPSACTSKYIRGTREPAGEIMSNKVLEFYTAHLHKVYFGVSENMSGGVTK